MTYQLTMLNLLCKFAQALSSTVEIIVGTLMSVYM
jgi:hypothetical protein